MRRAIAVTFLASLCSCATLSALFVAKPPPPPLPPRSLLLVPQTAEQETDQFPTVRSDVEIETSDYDRTPHVVAVSETPFLELAHQRARLFGDPDGKQGWAVDNFVLLEIVGEKGQILSRAAVGFTDPVRIGKEQVDSLGRMAFTFDAGEVELTSHLPEQGRFKIRATALDYHGVGRVSDVYVILDSGEQRSGDEDLRGQ